MLTLDQFEIQFNKLQASFGTIKPAKIMEQWYEEFSDLEYFPFVSAMKRLQYGDRFPNWDTFKSEYRNAVGSVSKEFYKGCQYCNNGIVLFSDINHKSKQVASQAGNCSLCSLGRIRDMANINPTHLITDSMGTNRTRRALAMDLESGMRVEPARDSGCDNSPGQTVRNVFGKDDPDQERKRYGSLKREELREAKP